MEPQLRIFVNLIAAAIAGGVIGWERSYFGRAAGLRTHVLLALGAATLMSVATWPDPMIAHFPPHTFQMDPARLIQGVMTGIGFLGAGVIVKEGVSLYGLTSAASIWISTTIGVVLGLGYLETGAAVTVATVLTLVILRRAELSGSRQVYALASFTFDVDRMPDQETFATWLAGHGAQLNHISVRRDPDHGRREYRGTIQIRREQNFRALDHALEAYQGLLGYEMLRNNK